MGIFTKFGNALASVFTGRGTSNTQPNGSDGIMTFGGYLTSNETNPELRGSRKWITYANAKNLAIIATGVRLRSELLAGTRWHAEPNPRGGAKAKKAADMVEEALFNAQLPRPWSSVVRKASMYKLDGFSLHEWTIKRRSDGMIVFADISHRPQYSIEQWNKPDEREPWDAVVQLTKQGNRFMIPRNRLFYCWDDTLTDSPDGSGLLRHVVQLVKEINALSGIEGSAFETDLRGMPIAYMPLADLRGQAATSVGADLEKQAAWVANKTKSLTRVLDNMIKTPERPQYGVLDSTLYANTDGSQLSQQRKWEIQLLRGDARGLEDINKAIERRELEVARVLGIEFVMMGGGNSNGSLAMHGDKTSMLEASLQTTLTETGDFATNDLARPIVALNGYDPEIHTPRLVAEPVSMEAIEAVCDALYKLSLAQLDPEDPAIQVIRERARLPPAPPPRPELLGVLGGPGRQPPGKDPAAGPPDPRKGEVEVEVDDLGPSSKPDAKKRGR